jgi:hypothetical protein
MVSEEDRMGYQLEGRILEVCNCNILCPCWVGEDPDPGTCDAAMAWHIDKGTIGDLDVAGRTLASVGFIPGNILAGNIKVALFVDDGASQEQATALLDVWTGKLGGPMGDLAQLFGEVVAMEQAPILFDVVEGKGTLRIGDGAKPIAEAVLAPYLGPTGKPTALVESIFSTIPGSPAYVGKASSYRRNTSEKYGMSDMNLEDHNAIQGYFSFSA